MKKILLATLALSGLFFQPAVNAAEVGCVSTTWRVVNNDKVCIQSFNDPDIEGVVCHLSHAQTGGISGALGLAENPSRFAISCRQVGPIKAAKAIPDKKENIFTQRMSLLFKDLNVTRLLDKPNNTLVYLVVSERVIEGSPYNSISGVPLMPWGDKMPEVTFKK